MSDPKFTNCPDAMAEKATVFTKTMHEACKALGGIAAFALCMGVSANVAERWLSGEEEPPLAVFLKSVDIVFHERESSGKGSPRARQ